MSTAASIAPAAGTRYWELLPTPVGTLCLVVDDQSRLVEIRLNGAARDGRRDADRCAAARVQIEQYFVGRRREFTLPLAPRGTAFQLRVWQALQAIPFGTVCNYGDVARAIGQPLAVRAVGRANGANPLPIVVPCHRVIAANGTIGGYSGGLAVKHRLLALEGVGLPF